MSRRIPELDAAIRWKTFYDLLTQRQFKEERDKGVVAAIFCLSKYPASFDTVVRWKALCDVLEKDPFKVDITRRGIIAALILLSIK
ncbi:MAG: hypothetical protein KGD59_03400 [Candidatus Heimdallarchaeota archaeon]|jgi:hypothetical protein|nr:hypothetical protein [Candidatus Heimdallarchaeota archaeon]MBY8993570.1 hypothetical protein [Candidatus Heimdallarchaeota archaeon]